MFIHYHSSVSACYTKIDILSLSFSTAANCNMIDDSICMKITNRKNEMQDNNPIVFTIIIV